MGALVLSVNPGLTAAEVRTVMRNTADKIGGVTYTSGDQSTAFYHVGLVQWDGCDFMARLGPRLVVVSCE